MSDCSDGRKKQRFTFIASLEGLRKAEESLLSLGFDSKSNFAESQLLSRSSVSNFFTRKPIQPDTFKRICEKLDLKWQSIRETKEEYTNKDLKEKQINISSYTEVGVEKMTTRISEKTVLDESIPIAKVEIKLRGDRDSIQSIQSFVSDLRANGGDTVEIVDIQEGSIKLIVEGSQEDINRLLLKIELGELTQIDGFPIESTQILSKDSEYEGSSKEKWRLIEEIVNNPTTGRNLENVDLSDADLSGTSLGFADLSGAYLIRAYLIRADLSDANLIRDILIRADLGATSLSGADLSGADLSGADLSGADLTRADLTRADLSGTILVIANLASANLVGADLRGADLVGTHLVGADLRRANLVGANLASANLVGADLRGANIEKARFSGVGYGGITEDLKQDLIKRGAIFEDSPGDRSSIFSGSPQSK